MRKDNVELICSVSELASLFESGAGLNGFLQKVVSLVAYHMKAAACSVFMYDEASQDLVAMMCRDTGIRPQDDYSNLERLEPLSTRSRNVLIEANGPRNHLVHRYNKRDDLLALESMKDLLPGIAAFGEEVEIWLEKMLSPG